MAQEVSHRSHDCCTISSCCIFVPKWDPKQNIQTIHSYFAPNKLSSLLSLKPLWVQNISLIILTPMCYAVRLLFWKSEHIGALKTPKCMIAPSEFYYLPLYCEYIQYCVYMCVSVCTWYIFTKALQQALQALWVLFPFSLIYWPPFAFLWGSGPESTTDWTLNVLSSWCGTHRST